ATTSEGVSVILVASCQATVSNTPPPAPSPKRRGGAERLAPPSPSRGGGGGRGCPTVPKPSSRRAAQVICHLLQAARGANFVKALGALVTRHAALGHEIAKEVCQVTCLPLV